MKKNGKRRTGIAPAIIGAIVLLLILYGVIVGVIGYVSLTDALKSEYAVTTFHMADTAATLVKGDHLEAYLNGEYAEEYATSAAYLDGYCRKMSVSLVYVIRVDDDCRAFTSVFNAVNNSVDNSTYEPWECGHRQETTNDEYAEKYRALYAQLSPYETVYRTNPKPGRNPHVTTMVPVPDEEGNTAGILCIERPMRELKDASRPYLRRIALWTVALCVAAGMSAAIYIRRQFVKPIRKASDEAVRFARENTPGEPLGSISRLREIENLACSIDTMETDMVRYIENLTAATAEKERIGAELSLASRIQAASVPNTFPAFSDRKDFEIFASMTPAKEVGGDFYNFFLIDDDHLLLAIGDVSGKGVPGALFMMVTNILVSDRMRTGKTPGEALTEVNRDLCEHNKAEMFVTIWLGILELSTGRIVFANAGHEDAAVCADGGAFKPFKTKHGFVAGGMTDIRYRDFELTLGPGDRLFLYTDGVPEATDENNTMFGMERMLDALNRNRERSPEETIKGVREDVNGFVGDAPQFDDMTMLCVRYHGTKKTNAVRELTVEAKRENLHAVTGLAEEMLEEAGCPMKTQMQIAVAVDEVFTNISDYAYPDGTGTAHVRAEFDEEEGVFTVTFSDGGEPFDPLSAEEPDITASAEARRIGGLGIFLVRKTMDDVRYEYQDGRNVLTIRKNIRTKQ